MTPAEKIALRLDDYRPGWYKEVNPDALDMDNNRQCLLGQLYGSYGAGMKALELAINTDDGVNYGVAVPDVWATDPNTTHEMLEGMFDAECERLKTNIVNEIKGRKAFDREVEAMEAEQMSFAREVEYV